MTTINKAEVNFVHGVAAIKKPKFDPLTLLRTAQICFIETEPLKLT